MALCSTYTRSLNFVGLTIRKISGILCVRITPSVTLTFDLETVALVVGNLPTNFGVSTAFRSRVMDRHASDWSRDLVTLGFDLGGHGACA